MNFMRFWITANKIAANVGAALEDDGAEDFVRDLFNKFLKEPRPNTIDENAWLRNILQSSFVSMEDMPKWTGEKYWPFFDGRPMVFLHQFFVSENTPRLGIPAGDTIYVFGAKRKNDKGEFSIVYRLVIFDEEGNRNIPLIGNGEIEF